MHIYTQPKICSIKEKKILSAVCIFHTSFYISNWFCSFTFMPFAKIESYFFLIVLFHVIDLDGSDSEKSTELCTSSQKSTRSIPR